jgi:alkane 1-monooxygenase
MPNPRLLPLNTSLKSGGHAWCVSLILPLCNFAMLSSGPHSWPMALAWTLPVWLCIAADRFGPSIADGTFKPLPNRCYLDLLCLLALLQWSNIVLMLRLAGELSWSGWAELGTGIANLAAMRIVTGTTSCCSGIALAHELVHRPSPRLRWLGRSVLWTVLYDHFALVHGPGHHRQVGLDADFSTARMGERFPEFWRRTVSGQFAYAWRLENARIQTLSVAVLFCHHRVFQGLVAEFFLLLAIGLVFGWVALAMFLYQAWVAVRMLETVNYFQHWGLMRQSAGAPAWSTRSWFSIHSLLGLPLHADHHRKAHAPFHSLQWKPGPELPYGYFFMAVLIRCADSRYRQLVKQQLNSAYPRHQFEPDVADRSIEAADMPARYTPGGNDHDRLDSKPDTPDQTCSAPSCAGSAMQTGPA